MTRVLAPWQPETELPTKLQIRALKSDIPSLLVGGSVASGKTSLALMMGSQYTEFGHYRCLILRKRFVDLSVPGNSLPRAKTWWPSFVQGRIHLQIPVSRHNYLRTPDRQPSASPLRQSSEFHRIVIDEAGEVPNEQIEFMASRVRKKVGDPIPTSFRLLSNPIGPSREYLRDRYVNSDEPERYGYIDAPTDWNIIDPEYMSWLESLPPLLKARLMHGDWDAEADTGFFEGLGKVQELRSYETVSSVRAWDFAATAGGGDYTVGTRIDWTSDPLYVVADVVRGQWAPAQRNKAILGDGEVRRPGRHHRHRGGGRLRRQGPGGSHAAAPAGLRGARGQADAGQGAACGAVGAADIQRPGASRGRQVGPGVAERAPRASVAQTSATTTRWTARRWRLTRWTPTTGAFGLKSRWWVDSQSQGDIDFSHGSGRAA